jgi:hypothetical protein
MAIDPSIIGNVMIPQAPQLPDVNAMMQTRTAGLENMYKIERQRAEDTRLEQERQAEALVEALAPAYATAFKGGGSKEALTAAYNLLPPEIQAGVKDQIDKLMAMPSDDLRLSALEASMAGSDAGRALLNRIPTEIQRINAEIQRGQLGVSQQRLAMEREKLIAAASQPKVAFRETDAEGNVRMYDAAGNEIGMLPKAGKPASGGAATTESERIAAYNAGRALKAAERIQSAIKDDPAATAPGMGEAFVNMFVDPNLVRSEERQRVSAAQREMIDALLTLATGAAYNREQLEGQMESFIPRWTDEEGTRADKRAALLDLIQNAKVKAGRSWTPDMDVAFQSLLTEAPGGQSPAGATSGGIREGTTATNPQTGERIIYRDGQWQPL